MFYPCSGQKTRHTPKSEKQIMVWWQLAHPITIQSDNLFMVQPLHGDPYQKATASLIDIPRTAGAGSYIYILIYTLYIYMIYDISMKPILGLGKKKRNRNIPNWMHGTITGDPDMYRQNPMTSCNIYIYTPWTVLNVIFVGKPPRWIQMFDGFWWWNLQFFGG